MCTPAEGSNVALKLHRLKQDVYDHVASMHGGFVEDASQQDEARKLRLSFEQFQQSLWPQVRRGLGGAAWMRRRDQAHAM